MTTVTLVQKIYSEVELMRLIRSTHKPEKLIEPDWNPREFRELCEIREIARNNDRARDEMVRLKPDKAEFYQSQWQEAEELLDKRAAKLKAFIRDIEEE